jgi:hypothetical protein
MLRQIPTLHDFARENWGEIQNRLIELEFDNSHFWLRHVRNLVFFRVSHFDSAITGAIFADEVLNSFETPDKLRSHFLEGWRQGFYGRLIDLPDPLNEQQIILSAVNPTLCWLVDGNAFETWTTHSQPLPLKEVDLWQISDADLAHLLSRDWNDENSPPRRALEWHRLDHWEKSWTQLSWIRGSREELENLTRWMVHSDPELWHERPLWGINYEFWPIGTAEIKTVRANSVLRPPSARLTRLGALFLQCNQAKLQRPPMMPSLTPDRSYSQNHYAFIHVRFTTPSAAEVTDACLNLRSWLNGRMHQYEIDALVSAPKSLN